ncbi:hypothetical protein P154DRAFT_401502, partial [Amniculicola lignicola CBS 123094]
TTTVVADRHLVSLILHHLSEMRYKDRRQRGPDQPVEFLEFRPTLVPSILVNKLWADEGTSILWHRYPHLPALKLMEPERRQYHANKVQRIFTVGPPADHWETLDYLDGLEWPALKYLEMEVDFVRHGTRFLPMLHSGLEHFELSGEQTGGSKYFADAVLPSIFKHSQKLKGIRFGPKIFPDNDPAQVSTLFQYMVSTPSISTVEVKAANFLDMDSLFTRLAQKPRLEALEIDLEPGLALLPLLQGPQAMATPFASLKRLSVMCYPDVALALLPHLSAIEDLQVDVCRMPNQQFTPADATVLEDLLATLSSCPQLRQLKVGVGALAINFPSASSFPRLRGAALISLGKNCPRLEDINLFATEPSALDASDMTSEQFDDFCATLPHLISLNLKLHPTTVSQLTTTALQSLGKHCKELEVLRLKVPFQLPSLPVPGTVPRILVDEPSPIKKTFQETHVKETNPAVEKIEPTITSSTATDDPIPPLFPHLTHLALARPSNPLAMPPSSTPSLDGTLPPSSIPDIPVDLEESLVRDWAHPLLMHFPVLEILEAWGDWSGLDNESLNYFLPQEEILATGWEFLAGVEQDLWVDDEEGD